MARAAATGASLGAAWGVAARVWMRLVSTEPAFTWVGTLAIVAATGVLGAGVGVAALGRTRGGGWRWLALAVAPGMLVFAGQGLPFLPAFVVGGVLLGRRHLLARLGVVACVVVPAVLLWWDLRLDEVTMLSAPTRVQVAMVIGMPLLATLLAMAGRLVWGPRPRPVQSPSPERARSSRLSDSSLEAPAGPA